jgi:hypothetical protein
MDVRCATRFWKRGGMAAVLAVGMFACSGTVLGQPEEQCSKLTSLHLKDTTIESAEVIDTGVFNTPGSAYP